MVKKVCKQTIKTMANEKIEANTYNFEMTEEERKNFALSLVERIKHEAKVLAIRVGLIDDFDEVTHEKACAIEESVATLGNISRMLTTVIDKHDDEVEKSEETDYED